MEHPTFMNNFSRYAFAAVILLNTPYAIAQQLTQEELVRLDASEAARLIRVGEITSVELVNAVLGRAKEFESLNAYITLAEDSALHNAALADKAISDGSASGRLHGVPIAVKDNIEVAGLQNTAGTPALSGYIPSSNAPIIQALLDEGAIIIGKNNMHELAMGITSSNTHFGSVGNPYRPDHFAGGSSGGTGAAVAADIATVGLGSDTGGSVRIPAAVNGVYGLRPTTGRYSQVGITPLSSTRDTAGPIAKSVADLILVDAAITGNEIANTSVPANQVRLGIPKNYYFDGVEGVVDSVFKAALDKISAAGIVLVGVELPNIAELQQAAGGPIRGYEGGPLLVNYLEDRTRGYTTVSELIGAIGTPTVKAVFSGQESGESEGAEEAYLQAINVERPKLQKVYADAFEENNIDAIVFPTTIATAKPIIGTDTEVSIDGKTVPTFPSFIHNTSPGSLAGIPGVTLPAGIADDGLPVGLGLDGPMGSDARLLAISLTLEEILGRIPRP
jgi:Asp-tRNA(Asn)/Glu-tRNA(Gln) amidotransferase A subunit family amidase